MDTSTELGFLPLHHGKNKYLGGSLLLPEKPLPANSFCGREWGGVGVFFSSMCTQYSHLRTCWEEIEGKEGEITKINGG